MFTEMANLRKNEETSRIGQKWLQEEDEELMKELIDKKSYEEIALNHKRTIGGIKSRVICNILYLQYKDKSKTIEELSLEYNIDNDDVVKWFLQFYEVIEHSTIIKACDLYGAFIRDTGIQNISHKKMALSFQNKLKLYSLKTREGQVYNNIKRKDGL